MSRVKCMSGDHFWSYFLKWIASDFMTAVTAHISLSCNVTDIVFFYGWYDTGYFLSLITDMQCLFTLSANSPRCWQSWRPLCTFQNRNPYWCFYITVFLMETNCFQKMLDVIFISTSMRVCSSTPPKQNQDFVKEHNRTTLNFSGCFSNFVVLLSFLYSPYSLYYYYYLTLILFQVINFYCIVLVDDNNL